MASRIYIGFLKLQRSVNSDRMSKRYMRWAGMPNLHYYPDAMETEDLLKQINVVLKQFSKEELQKLYKILTVLKNLK